MAGSNDDSDNETAPFPVGRITPLRPPPVPETFAEHPKSVAEIRSDKSNKTQDWTPRDLLISILRDIDAGKIKPTEMAVVWSEAHYDAAGKPAETENSECGAIRAAGIRTDTIAGMIQVALWRFIRSNC